MSEQQTGLFSTYLSLNNISISLLLTVYVGNFPVGLVARKKSRRATFLRPKRVPKTKKKSPVKIPKQKENY